MVGGLGRVTRTSGDARGIYRDFAPRHRSRRAHSLRLDLPAGALTRNGSIRTLMRQLEQSGNTVRA